MYFSRKVFLFQTRYNITEQFKQIQGNACLKNILDTIHDLKESTSELVFSRTLWQRKSINGLKALVCYLHSPKALTLDTP